MKIYTASKAKHAPWWQSLRAAGLNICASWIDWKFNYNGEPATAEDWASHWKSCIDQAASCDVLLLFCLDGEVQKGALIELGAALAAGRRVFMVTPYDWSWCHHPQVQCFDTLAQAIEALQTEG